MAKPILPPASSYSLWAKQRQRSLRRKTDVPTGQYSFVLCIDCEEEEEEE